MLNPNKLKQVKREGSIKGFKLLGHDREAAWGGGSIVEIRKHHAYVGAVGGSWYNGPEGFTCHDVSDPRNPRKVWEFRAPPGLHMHKLRIVGDDILYVNAEALEGDAGVDAPCGFFIFDISKPAEPKQIGFYDMPGIGPHRFGVDNKRQLAFMPCQAEGWEGRVCWTLDTRNPENPDLISIWGMPNQKAGTRNDNRAKGDKVVSLHGPPNIRGDRMFAAFLGGGVAIIDCTDLRNMKLAGHVCWTPPFFGKTHTAWPLGDRPYLIVTDEAHGSKKFWDSQFMWVVDIREETNPTPVATWFPERKPYFDRPGRFGAHNVLEYMPSEGPWKDIVFITYFSAGLRAVDVSDPLKPKEVGHFLPALEEGIEEIQSNDIGCDEHGRIYLVDRWGTGMHILEYTG